MTVKRIEILNRAAYADGQSFANTGPYERIDAIAHYVVDPENSANTNITDLGLAERNKDGLVEFAGDLTIIKPVDMATGNGALLMQVPNRGNRSIARLNLTPVGPVTSAEVEAGDGFLFRRGWTVAWAGWQCDVPRTAKQIRVGLTPPQVPLKAREPMTQMQLRIQPNERTQSFALTDHHVGDLGHHTPVRPLNPYDDDARLLVRRTPYETPAEIDRRKWQFAKAVDGEPVSNDSHIWLEGGFEPGFIYDILYTPRDCPVVGAGMLATRDCASFLRYDDASPLGGGAENVIGEGQSQCGRFLRTYLHAGLNTDEKGRIVLDGILAHIAGGRRGEFNHRYAQPSVQPTPSFGHLFPFGDLPQKDPFTGKTAGLLDRHRETRHMPKIFYTDTSAEYWRGDAGLSHTNLETGGDADLPDNVRRYLFASTQHGPGVAVLTDRTQFGSVGCNFLNIVDYRPLYRAALEKLRAWVSEGTEPPESDYPMAVKGTRQTRREGISAMSVIADLTMPSEDVLTTMHPLSLGADVAKGIAVVPPVTETTAYTDYVSAVDDDGNEAAGIRMPDVSVPVATHTGFNPRHPETGGTGQLLEYVGSSLPFAKNALERETTGDPRLSVSERYADRDDYLDKVRSAAEKLVGRGHLLAEDIELCIELAAERYDICS
ncbi:MAG: hypothetical protein CFH10_01226 [Alphaproteobacteria bacterium MarineAlpha4_Bin2]|nr:MAG: hypothetical protein CFH10_01226 [Alphaproteobacteria bacterium MarineAlpha4_Bin2]